jgi:hypothetical protein
MSWRQRAAARQGRALRSDGTRAAVADNVAENVGRARRGQPAAEDGAVVSRGGCLEVEWIGSRFEGGGPKQKLVQVMHGHPVQRLAPLRGNLGEKIESVNGLPTTSAGAALPCPTPAQSSTDREARGLLQRAPTARIMSL